MSDLKLLLVNHYRRGFLTSSMIDNDIKIIRKLNSLLCKLVKTEKEIYTYEIKNILKSLNNDIRIGEIQDVFEKNIDEVHHTKLKSFIEEVLRNEIFVQWKFS